MMRRIQLALIPGPDDVLAERHYLGPSKRAQLVYEDDLGVVVFGRVASRNLPKAWLELQRWCLYGGKNNGTRQWSRVVKWVRERSDATTVVSYSDPSAGHDGALYRACNWLWAPTWHRLRPPPSGFGKWTDGKPQAVKDRWVFVFSPDADRERILAIKDASIIRRMPWSEYREPKWKRGVPSGGGGDYRRFINLTSSQ